MLKLFWQRFACRWAILGLLLGGVLAAPVFRAQLYDDAYIHARLAEHLLAWGMPIFNAGAVFKVGSSSGFVLLIAAIGRWLDPILAIRIIDFVALTLCVSALVHLAARARDGVALNLRVLAVVGAIPYLLLAGLGGMETPVACMLLAFAAVAFQVRRYTLVVFWISLSIWFRVESTLLWGLAVLYFVARGPRQALLGSWPLLLLIAFDLHFFGTLLPHAAHVKSVAYGFPWPEAVKNAMSFGQPYGAWSALLGGLVLMAWLNALASVRGQGSDLRPSVAFLTLSAGMLFAWLLGRTVIFQWYYCLLVFPYCLSVLLGGDSAKGGFLSAGLTKRLSLMVLLLFLIFGLKSLGPVFGKGEVPGMNFRVLRYLDIGRVLYAECPSCSVVTSEIGGLGYAFKGRVLDAFGLGDPAAVRFHPMRVPQDRQGYHIGAIPPAYVRLKSPDFIVSMPVFSMALRASGELRNYRAYACPLSLDSNVIIFGDRQIEVYARQVLSPSALMSMGCLPV